VRQEIEHALLNIVFDIALKGPGVLRPAMSSLVRRMKGKETDNCAKGLLPLNKVGTDASDPGRKRLGLLAQAKNETREYPAIIDVDDGDWKLISLSSKPNTTRDAEAADGGFSVPNGLSHLKREVGLSHRSVASDIGPPPHRTYANMPPSKHLSTDVHDSNDENWNGRCISNGRGPSSGFGTAQLDISEVSQGCESSTTRIPTRNLGTVANTVTACTDGLVAPIHPKATSTRTGSPSRNYGKEIIPLGESTKHGEPEQPYRGGGSRRRRSSISPTKTTKRRRTGKQAAVVDDEVRKDTVGRFSCPNALKLDRAPLAVPKKSARKVSRAPALVAPSLVY
jgi:hypothetical protein